MTSNFKIPIVRSEAYRRYIAEQPCLICGTTPCQAAHISVGNYGRGIKAGDDICVPVCPPHHAIMDANQTLFILEYAHAFGVDVVKLAKQAARERYLEWESKQ